MCTTSLRKWAEQNACLTVVQERAAAGRSHCLQLWMQPELCLLQMWRLLMMCSEDSLVEWFPWSGSCDYDTVALHESPFGPVWPGEHVKHVLFHALCLIVLTFKDWKSLPSFWCLSFLLSFFNRKIWQLWAYIVIWSYLAGIVVAVLNNKHLPPGPGPSFNVIL